MRFNHLKGRAPATALLFALAALTPEAPCPSAAIAAPPFPATQGHQANYSGRAFAAYVSSPLAGIPPTYICDSGQLSASGGFSGNTFDHLKLSIVLSANALVAVTSGAGGLCDSFTGLSDVVLLPTSATPLQAFFMTSHTMVNCTGGMKTASAFTALVFCGQYVPVTGQPNQTITVAGLATLVINEQTSAVVGGINVHTTNAIHLWTTLGDEIILGGSSAGVTGCGGGPGPCDDFVTGGGWFGSAGAKKNFGFVIGNHNNQPGYEGQLNYLDHGTGMHLKATSVTSYSSTGPTSRHADGTCEVDGMGGFYFAIDVADNGEPGTGVDYFQITVSNGYFAEGTLRGGNIQLHCPCQ